MKMVIITKANEESKEDRLVLSKTKNKKVVEVAVGRNSVHIDIDKLKMALESLKEGSK